MKISQRKMQTAVKNIPEMYAPSTSPDLKLFVYDFKMTEDTVKTKVKLSMNMLSFLQIGRKQVHFADTAVAVNKSQSLLIKNGNCLWTELLDTEEVYFCKLFFFSNEKLLAFLQKHQIDHKPLTEERPWFAIGNDDFISSYLDTLSTISRTPSQYRMEMLTLKLEEILLYLIGRYGDAFKGFLHSLISENVSNFKQVVESNAYSGLRTEELAFLCNMSLSTFKRHFVKTYNQPPGKWLRETRLQKAKEMLEQGEAKPSEIFYQLGYNNLSNFSAAFKARFGFAPKDACCSVD